MLLAVAVTDVSCLLAATDVRCCWLLHILAVSNYCCNLLMLLVVAVIANSSLLSLLVVAFADFS
jgi:hypothetical protein